MNRRFLLIFALSLIFLSTKVSAVQLTVTPTSKEVSVREEAWYTLSIYNDKLTDDEFIISVYGPHLEWLNLESYYVKVKADESKNVKIFFYPLLENSYQYEVMVFSRNNPDEKSSRIISLKVFPEKEVKIMEISSIKIGEDLNIYLKIYSKDQKTLKINFEILDEKGNIVKTKEISRNVEGHSEIKDNIYVGDLLGGKYKLKASIPQFEIYNEVVFQIPYIHNVITKKEVISTPFGEEVIITLINDGNVEEDYIFEESLGKSQNIDFVDEPLHAYVEENDIKYRWKIEGLAVGKSTTIRYKINRLPYVVSSFIIVFCLVVLLGMGVVKLRVPYIKKECRKKKDDYTIVLQVKGALTNTIKNVMIKDRITPLASVIPEFTGPKPVVRHLGDAGTELIWSLGDIKPRSEIILSYKIKPLVEAQLKMPRACLIYRTDEENKMRVFSKSIIVE